jgi:hypothetical protein
MVIGYTRSLEQARRCVYWYKAAGHDEGNEKYINYLHCHGLKLTLPQTRAEILFREKQSGVHGRYLYRDHHYMVVRMLVDIQPD